MSWETDWMSRAREERLRVRSLQVALTVAGAFGGVAIGEWLGLVFFVVCATVAGRE